MTTVNRAVREHLKSISNTERTKTLRVLVWLRAVFTALYLAQTLFHVLKGDAQDMDETLPLFIVYAAVSMVMAVAVEVWPQVYRIVGLSLPLVDIPMVVAAGWLAVPVMAAPHWVLNSVLPFLPVFVFLSTLSLDLRIITLTMCTAVIGAVIISRRVDAPWVEIEDPVFAMVASGALGTFVVTRVKSLVEESRRKDFAGKYILGERIGSGGMAEVFSATYSPEGSFERRVAVKRVLPAYASNEDFIRLFRREAELGALLAHPNLVQIFDFGRHLDSWFLAMEFIEGVTLGEVMRSRRDTDRLPLNVCLYIIAEVAEGLSYLHEKRSADGTHVGLLHRDLNPPNVLLSKTGEVKVSDFGVARWTGGAELTQLGTVRGKIAYTAPEHLQGDQPSLSGDIFALGVMLHELVAGARLFRGSNEGEVARAVLHAEIALPSLGREEAVPPEVDRLVMGLLERDPSRRIASARVVANTLRSLTGPAAPYPSGREGLVEIIATLDIHATALPAAPSTSNASHNGETAPMKIQPRSPDSTG